MKLDLKVFLRKRYPPPPRPNESRSRFLKQKSYPFGRKLLTQTSVNRAAHVIPLITLYNLTDR